jgi:hypothetical protein
MKKVTVLVTSILVVLVAMSTQGLCQEDGVDACYKKMNGQLRISDNCRPSESSISLVSREEFEALVARVDALEERVEVLEEGGDVDPCEGMGDDCCITDDQCLGDPSVCVDASMCRGVRFDGVCVDNECVAIPVNDDSGCDGEEALDCDGEVVLCTDEVEQDPPTCP